VASEYRVECPKYKTECDIDSCPRFLANTSIGNGASGSMVGSGFCNERGHRYFSDVRQEKITFVESEDHAREQATEEAEAGKHGGAREREVAFSSVTGLVAGYPISVKDAQEVKVYIPNASETFAFTAAGEWKVINRFLESLAKGEDNRHPNYPVPLTTKEKNACKGRCLALIEKFVERQPAKRKLRNAKYEPFARFRVELLRGGCW